MQASENQSKILSKSDEWVLSNAEFKQLAGELLKQGLIAHYPFNGNAQDISGHSLHGTVYGATLTSDRFGTPNNAYQFDGIDDYIEIAHNDLLNLAENFTISLWIKQAETNTSRGYRLVDKTTAGVNDGYNFDTYDGSTGRKLRLTGGQQNVSANTVFSLNKWHHVAVVFSKGLSTFYLDGRIDGSGKHNSETIKTNSLTLRIGAAHGSNNEFFKGAIDDIRIYNRALSQIDIQELYEFPATLQQNILNFDGQDDYVVLPGTNIDYSQGFTVEAWVLYNSFKHWSRIIDFGNGAGKNNIVFANPGTTKQLAIDVKTSAGEKRVTSAEVLETGKWMHLAATIDKSGVGKLYKNGQLIQSGQLQLPETINRTQNYIGKSNWSIDGYFDGQISEVRVWNIARSQEQIQQQIHSRLVGNEVNLVGYWPLNEGSGTTVVDKTGRGQNGTIYSATWQQQLIPIKPSLAIKLKSWKGDYLHRPDTAQGVTSWNTGIGNEWIIESIGNNKIKLKSWKGDYLHRPDTAQGITTWHTGIGNEWLLEVISTPSQPQPEIPTTEKETEPEPTAVATGDVFISQIFYRGKIKRTQNDEYIEITNNGTTPADLSGWRVTSAGSNKQVFTFVKGTVLQPGKSFRVYSNQVHPASGGFSFGSSTAIWKDSGDEGKLFDAQGNNVSTWAYGTNSIAGIKAELGVPQLVVEASPSAIIRQTALGGKVTFAEALKLALRSFLEDENDIGSPLSLMLSNPGGYDGLPPNADKATTMEVLRSYVNQPNAKIILYSAKRGHELEGSETTETNWIFELIADQINSEQHWAIVDRAGEKAPYNYCVG